MDSSDGEVDEKEFALADEESEGSAPAGQAGAVEEDGGVADPPALADAGKAWPSPNIGLDYVVSGGFLPKPHHVQTRVHSGERFVCIRQYDTWVVQILAGKSRRVDPLKDCTIWQSMLRVVAGAAEGGDDAEAAGAAPAAGDDDPFEEILADSNLMKRKKPKKKPRACNVIVAVRMAEDSDIRVYVPKNQASKTVWVHEGDVGRFLTFVAKD